MKGVRRTPHDLARTRAWDLGSCMAHEWNRATTRLYEPHHFWHFLALSFFSQKFYTLFTWTAIASDNQLKHAKQAKIASLSNHKIPRTQNQPKSTFSTPKFDPPPSYSHGRRFSSWECLASGSSSWESASSTSALSHARRLSIHALKRKEKKILL